MFKYVRVGEFMMYGSFKGQHVFNDVLGVIVKIHTRNYHSELCTVPALLLKMRKDVILDILSQVCTACVWRVALSRQRCDLRP